MYATANLKERYREGYVATASPLDLIIFLYDGCIKQIKLALIHQESGLVEQTGAALMRAQDIVAELMSSLDLSFKLSEELMLLYEYIVYELIQMNTKKDLGNAPTLLEMMTSLKEAWAGVKAQTDRGFIAEELL